MSELRIFPKHARALDLCIPGQRRMARSLGLDFRAFAREGIAESEFAKIAHPMVPRIIEIARQEAHSEQE